MKLRLENNKVCFRINREELDELIESGKISSKTSGLSYCVKSDDKIITSDLIYGDNKLTLYLPLQLVIKHKNELPSKEGVLSKIKSDDSNYIIASLEVDVRSKAIKK